MKIFKTKNKLTTDIIKIRWRLTAWGLEKILKILTQKMVRTKNNRLIMKSKCLVCGIKNSRFIKYQEGKG